jgi:uncharacterized protein (TIGR03382 family)
MRRAVIALVSCSSLLLAGSWLASSALAQDVGAAREAVCCGAACCLIDGDCLTDGEANSRNPCEVCEPAMSQSEWTTTAGCVAPDSGPATEPDAGSPPPPPPPSGGCSASGAGSAGIGVALGVLGLALAWRRRR